jgi:hypothetical protein
MVRSSDGSKYSLPVMLNVQAQPKPNFEYIGFRGRRQSNNDTATLQEANKPTAPPLDFRLNDVVGGRFRMVSISAAKVILEDTTLGFRHELPIVRPQGGTQTTDGRGNFNDRRVPGGRFPNNPTVVVPTYNPPTTVYNPTMPGNTQPPQSEIPGIPNNIPRYIPPTPQPQKPQQQQKQQKDDDDDDDDGDGR